MQEKALLLTADYASADDQKAERLLNFFGVRYLKQRATELGLPENKSAEKYRLVCSAQAFARLVGDLQNVSCNSNSLARQIHSVFLYSSGDPVALAKRGKPALRSDDLNSQRSRACYRVAYRK